LILAVGIESEQATLAPFSLEETMVVIPGSFSIGGGLAIPLLLEFPAALFALIPAGLAACAIGKAEQSAIVQSLFQHLNPRPASDGPLLDKLQARLLQAEEAAQQFDEQYDREAGNSRWGARRNELLSQIETYKNLAQIKQSRLQELESEARVNQLEEFLDQFDIHDADINGVNPTVKTVLLSHGVETAADVVEIEDLTRIPSIETGLAESLLEWRRGLEQEFVFDPARGVPHEARIRTEREIEALRFRLERELSGGARHLRQLEQEIETSRKNLLPASRRVRQELAQAEKDVKVVSKRNSAALILAALVIAFFIGWGIGPMRFWMAYLEGEMLSTEGRLADAVQKYQKAVKIDPRRKVVYEQLGQTLYTMNRYEESAEAWRNAITLGPDFNSYYNLGLVHIATKNWEGALLTFQLGLNLRDESSWKREYTEAYYYRALSLAKLGRIHDAIRDLELEADSPIKSFELATLYLCIGRRHYAISQYQLIDKSSPALAQELWELITRSGAWAYPYQSPSV
jgi:tetratricopeptide (TPR) repeat protein